MLSLAFPATGVRIPSDLYLGTGFTPWDTEPVEAPFVYPPQEPVFSNSSGSDDSTPKTVSSNSGSDDGDPGRDPPESKPNTNPSPNPNSFEERKRRRMISNRESARRSRMRKHRHLENLRNQVNRHKTGNRELMNRLRFVCHHGQLLRQENERLRSESVMLRQKLWDIRQVLLVRQLQSQLSTPAWPCNNNMTSMNEQNPPS